MPCCWEQAQRQASELQQAVQRPLAALGQGIGEATSSLQRGLDGIFDRAPALQQVRAVLMPWMWR